MKTACTIVAWALAIATGLAIAPGFALGGQQARGFQSTGPVVGGATLGTSRSVAVPFPDQPFLSRSTTRSFVRPSLPFTVVTPAPTVVYTAPPVYYVPPAYYEPPASYRAPVGGSPPVGYAPPRSPAVSVAPGPMQDIVQFSTGRYELRGDGVSMPYTWVWIPNPPTAPPAAAAAPPSTAPTEEPTVAPAPRRSQLYRWTDAQGTEHWTDRLDAVPEQYRPRSTPATRS